MCLDQPRITHPTFLAGDELVFGLPRSTDYEYLKEESNRDLSNRESVQVNRK